MSAVGSRDIDLLVVGDINPDVVVSDPDPRPVFGQVERTVAGIQVTIGGSATLAACAAARLGLRVALVAAVGDDALGRLVLELVAARGVDVSDCRVITGAPTGTSVILAGGGDRAILTATGAIAELRATDVPDALLARARHVHTGSFFLQPGLAAGLPSLFRAARAAGASTSLDPNHDPVEAWDSGFATVAAETDVLLPNAVEATALARVDDPVLAARRLGAGTVAVKLGAEGAIGIGASGDVVHVGAPHVDTVDAIGAGDAFDAGFIAGLLDGRDLEGCLRLAVASGALSTRSAGGVDGQATRDETEALARPLVAR